jgi:hypothetical protein
MTLQQIKEARELATPITYNFTADDTFPAIVIQYVPALGTGGTSASFTLANDSIVFLVNSATPAGADVIGASGKMATDGGTYDTMGEFVDYINGRQAWRAYLVGALRSMTTIGLLDKSSTTCHGAEGTVIFIDTTDYDTTVGHSFAISGEKFLNNGINGHVTDKDSACENALMYGSFLITGDSDGLVLKYYSGAQGSTETLLHSYTINAPGSSPRVDGEENPTEPYIRATRGERLIIQVTTASADLGAPTFTAIGKVAVLKNDRLVASDNFGDA